METIIKRNQPTGVHIVTSIMSDAELKMFEDFSKKIAQELITESVEFAYKDYLMANQCNPSRLLLNTTDLINMKKYLENKMFVRSYNELDNHKYRGCDIIECKSDIKPTFTN